MPERLTHFCALHLRHLRWEASPEPHPFIVPARTRAPESITPSVSDCFLLQTSFVVFVCIDYIMSTNKSQVFFVELFLPFSYPEILTVARTLPMKPCPISPVIPIEVLIPGNLPRRCSVSLFLLHSEVPIVQSRPSDPMNQMFSTLHCTPVVPLSIGLGFPPSPVQNVDKIRPLRRQVFQGKQKNTPRNL